MIGAPISAKAQIAVTERTGERNLTDIGKSEAGSNGGGATSSAASARVTLPAW